MPRLRPLAAAGAALAALALPAPALAAQTSYVVTVQPAVGVSCDRTILEVTMSHDLVPARIYTDSVCGFSASLSKSAVRNLAADPRVVSVTADGVFSPAS